MWLQTPCVYGPWRWVCRPSNDDDDDNNDDDDDDDDDDTESFACRF